MQFPVPQFTDVEDKIIGSLTIKQFGILFGVGILVFLPFSVTKSIAVLIIFALLLGLPGLALAFGKLNGRPMYNMIGYFTQFMTSPKILVFHKEGSLVSDRESSKNSNQPAPIVAQATATNPRQRLREVNRLLEDKAREEQEMFK